MTYLITCLCGRSLLRQAPFGICENCKKIKPQKETQYDYALKEHKKWMKEQNFNEDSRRRSLVQFNKRWDDLPKL